MESEAIAVVIVFVTLIVTVGATTLLLPITKRLGAYLEVATEEKRKAPRRIEGEEQLLESLGRVERRLDALEDRQEFSEQLLRDRRPSQISSVKRDQDATE